MLSRTAKILASRRALELEKKNPLIHDQFSPLFTDQESMAFANETKDEIHYVMMRHKALDDLVARKKNEFKQIILLGSGFDTKSLRFKEESIKFIELDSPEVIKHKKNILNKYGYDKVTTHSTFIHSTLDLSNIIKSTDPSFPTLVLAEGFFMYLKPELARECFRGCLR